MNKFFKIITLLAIITIGYFSWRFYHYLFDTHAPIVSVRGIEDGGWYADEISCFLEGSDTYNVVTISAFLDDKPLVNNYAIQSKNFSYPFTIATKQLSKGPHILSIEATNGIYHAQTTKRSIPFNVDNTVLQAAIIKPSNEHKVFQGRTLHVQVQVNKEVDSVIAQALSDRFGCFKEADNSPIFECFIPIDCEEKPNEYLLTIEVTDKVGNSVTLEQKFQIVAFPFKKQHLNVPPEKVEAERKAGLSAKKLDEDIIQLTALSPQKKLWHGAFVAPIEIDRVTTDFGVIRTTQERGRYMHKAVDIINTPKSVVWATQDGNVVLKDRYEYSGNTIAIDHGYGILTLYFHLDSFADLEVGDTIKRGNPIGTIGKTGYADGYHLHWEMRVNNVAVDPLQWIKPHF
jgi:murein DD-endopeptidase MepM/ murein hydrolase activator NlpD